jgi:tRNA pseudouridine55 synthase
MIPWQRQEVEGDMRTSAIDGLLVVDKPTGITSRDAVNRAQRWFPRGVKLGHTGTLDPLATGVLVLCLGQATRLTEYVQNMTKTYRTIVRLGGVSDTDDADGTITPRQVEIAPTREEIDACITGFVGEIDQVPPAYSAAKVTGQRAYALARAGEDVNLAARRIRIDGIDVMRYQFPLLELEVRCGKGTYIRSLARDIGQRLGCGGYVEELRRTRVGPFHAEDGLSPDSEGETARSKLLPLTLAVSELPRLTLTEPAARRLRQGGAVPLEDSVPDTVEAAAFTEDGTLFAVVRIEPQSRLAKPVKVLN